MKAFLTQGCLQKSQRNFLSIHLLGRRNVGGNIGYRDIIGSECVVITYSKSKDQPGKVANPARGQLNRENEYFFPVSVRA